MTLATLWHAGWASAILNHLWQSTLVIAVAWLLALALRKNPAHTRYWVWIAASLKFLLPFSLLMAAGEWLRSWLPAPAARPAVANAVMQVTQPFAGAESFNTASLPVATHPASWLPLALLAVWLGGAFVVAIRFGCGWLKVYAMKRAALPLALAADVPALSSPTLMEPGIFGILRPVLLLPEGILERLTAEQIRAIVAHEMCHVKRRDNLTFAIHMIVEALFWFHPAVWWIGKRLIDERERACDEAVVQAGGEAQAYAEGILNVCKFCVESPVACVAGVTGADLKKRIARIMTEQLAQKVSLNRKLLLGMVGLAAFVAPIVIGEAESAWKPGIVTMRPVLVSSGAQNSIEKEQPMAKDASPAFGVVTIKPSDPNSPRQGWSFESEGHRITCFNATLNDIVSMAYGIHNKQVVGVPERFNKDRFDISGIPDLPGVPSLKQEQHMYQELLANRFHMVIHRETREIPIYAISVAKGGPNLGTADPRESLNTGNRMGGGQRTLRFTNMPMSVFALNLDFYLDRPVVDRTNLKGRYDFTLKWTYDDSRVNDSDAAPSLPTALKEQLGLEITAVKGPADVFVIDHVEPPSPN